MQSEHQFQRKVKKKLNSIERCYHFTKEALALRGLPDIVGCYQGQFFAWELKKDKKEAQKKTGRNVLQWYILEQIRKAGGIGEVVYPDNLEDKLQELLSTHRH